MKILFLDIDGVLNGHEKQPNGYCGIDQGKAGLLAKIVAETDCLIVLASSWRYLILSGSMTLTGFANLLLSHGVSKVVTEALYGLLPEDVDPNDPHDRGKLAAKFLVDIRRLVNVAVAVALDDIDCGYEANGIPHVWTAPYLGMTPNDARRAIALLTGRS